MSTFDEVIAAAQANIAALDQARDHIESTKAKAEQAQQQAMMLGAERLAHGTQGVIDSCQQAQSQIAATKETLQALIAHTNQLKAYEPGGGTSASGQATVATQHSDGTPLPEPDGEKLVQDSRQNSRRRGVNALLDKTGDAVDSMKEFAGTADRIISVKDNGRDFFTPTHNTAASTEVPRGQPVVSQDPPPHAGLVEGAMVLYVGAVTITESVRWVNQKIQQKRKG